MLSPGQGHCCCYRREALLKPEDKTAHATIRVFLTYLAWLGGVTVRASDLRSNSRGFDSQLGCYQAT